MIWYDIYLIKERTPLHVTPNPTPSLASLYALIPQTGQKTRWDKVTFLRPFERCDRLEIKWVFLRQFLFCHLTGFYE